MALHRLRRTYVSIMSTLEGVPRNEGERAAHSSLSCIVDTTDILHIDKSTK